MSSTEVRARVSVAVLVPCYNEAAAIGVVVQDFRRALPEAQIYVYDNNSTDGSAESAAHAGAIVRKETLQGKGHVVRRMFADVEADVYLLVDGDGTYDAASAPALIQRLVGSHLDMVSGVRAAVAEGAYRAGHRFGNKMLSTMVRRMFGSRVNDLLSGYRVFSRRFVKSFPVMSSGFEIETELTVHALELDMPIDEIVTPYHERVQGTASKLRTYRDGFRILRTILLLTKEQKPLAFFGFFGALLAAISVILAWPIFVEYAATGLVPRFPTAILSTGLMLSGFLAVTCGLVLDSVARGRREIKRLAYLQHPLIAAPLRSDPNSRRP